MSAAHHNLPAEREIFTFSRLAEFCTLRELEKQIGHGAENWPTYVEGAFVWTPDRSHRPLIGVNFSSAPSLSIGIDGYSTVSTLLAQRHCGQGEPVTVMLHLAHPRPTFTNLGKTQLSLPRL